MTPSTRPSRRGLRLFLIIAGSLAGLLVLAAAVAPFFIPWDKLKTQAEQKISAALKHEVRIGSVGFNPFRGIEIRKLTVANAAGFASQPLLSDEAVIVQYRLLPLLWGRVALKAVVLDQPVLLIEKGADGRYNFSDMLAQAKVGPAPAAAPAPVAQSGAKTIPLELLISRLAVTGASLTYQDHGTGKTQAVEELNLELRNLTLAGLAPTTLQASARLRANGADLPLRVDARWRLHYNQQKLTLEEFKVTLPGVLLAAQGEVAQFLAQPELKLTGALTLELAQALAGFGPLAGKSLPRDFKLTGGGAFHFTVAGPIKDLKMLQVTGDDDLQAQVSAAGLQVPVRLGGTVSLAGGTLDLGQKLTVPGLQADLGVKILDLAATRNVQAKLTAKLDLAVSESKLVPPAQAGKLAAFKAKGRVELTAIVAGPASEPKKMDVSAQCKAEAVSVAFAGKPAVEDLTGTISVLPDRVSLPGLTAKLGGQPVKLIFLAQGFDLRLPATLKPEALKAKVDWNLSSPMLDVDALLALVPAKPAAAAESAASGAPSAPATVSDLPEPDARKFLPAGLVMRGTAALGGMKFGQVKLGRMDFRLELKDRILSETGVLAGYKGSISEKTRLDFSQSLLAYTVDAETKNVDLEPLLNDVVDTFVAAKLKKPQIISEIKGKLTGLLSGQLHIAGAGLRTAAAKPRLTGQGAFTLKDGRIRQFTFQEQLAKLFGSEKFRQDIPFDHTVVNFTLADLMVNLTKFVAESGPQGRSGDIRMEAQGLLTFGAAFKAFHLRPSLNPRASAQLSPEFGQYAEVLKDDRGWVNIPVTLNGPVSKPDVQPDWDWIKQQFGGYVQKKTKAAADEAGKKIQNFIQNQQGKSTDQVKEDLGGELNKAKDQLQNLKNLFH